MLLRRVDLGPGGTFIAGESGAEVTVAARHGGSGCHQSGKVTRRALETELSFKLSKRSILLEVCETHWDKKVSIHMPGDTATHRARNLIRAYENMPGGRNVRLEITFSKCSGPAVVSGAEVNLQLKDGALKWLHNPHRLYGPWGERESGPFVPCAPIAPPHPQLRLTFPTAADAIAFEVSVAIARDPAPKRAAAAAQGGENGNPQAPPNPLRPLEGLSVVFTGDGPRREALEADVRLLGGKVTSAVSGRTSFLVAYTHSTVKYRKAAELQHQGKPGPKIVTETEIRATLAEAKATRKAAEAKLHAQPQVQPQPAHASSASSVHEAGPSTSTSVSSGLQRQQHQQPLGEPSPAAKRLRVDE
jgi:hypothetical protein